MRSPRIVLFSVSLLFAGFIVVRGASPVNHNEVNSNQKKWQLVDGAPLPPPHADGNSALFADGAPLPPPHLDGGTMLSADGAPLPPPHADANTMLLADGAPLPPPHQTIESTTNAKNFLI